MRVGALGRLGLLWGPAVWPVGRFLAAHLRCDGVSHGPRVGTRNGQKRGRRRRGPNVSIRAKGGEWDGQGPSSRNVLCETAPMVCGASGLLLGVQRARLHQSRDADHYDRADLTHREHCVRSFAPQRNGEGGTGRVSLGTWRAAARPAPDLPPGKAHSHLPKVRCGPCVEATSKHVAIRANVSPDAWQLSMHQ